MWLWSGAGGLVLVIAAVVVTIAMTRSGAGPAHVMGTPNKIGAYERRPQLEQQMRQLQQQMVAKSAGQVSRIVSAVYEDNASAPGGATPQMILFIGGNLSGVSASGFISGFTGQFKGAKATGAGPMGGLAACVNAQPSVLGTVAQCTWADNDTFGVVASPTMNAAELAKQMRAIRPSVEHLAK